MRRKVNSWLLASLLLASPSLRAQDRWRGALHRPDGETIVFTFEWKNEKKRDVWYIRNASERMRVDDIRRFGDSMLVVMPVFESSFRLRILGDSITGEWIKHGAQNIQHLPFTAARSPFRFSPLPGSPAHVAGKWSVSMRSDSVRRSMAEFDQTGNVVTGTFLRPTGDYRFLEGVVGRDSMVLSSFDGSNAYLFKVSVTDSFMRGMQYSGATAGQPWTAIRDSLAAVSDSSVSMRLKPGQTSIHFSFPDLAGQPVEFPSARFRNKVVLVQIMGSWCPNCLDETAYLSEWYKQNRSKGVEVVALAYEYTTDRDRSAASLEKFRRRFDVQYPMLITGVAVGDSLRTEKTLPELTPIRVFPSLIIIDRKGVVRKLDTGFSGPATGEYFDRYKRELETFVERLLAEQ